MKLYSTELAADRADVLRSKYVYGFWFGVFVGLTFSIFAWGLDAFQLSRINGLYPWLKFLVGVLPCMVVGGFTGWLSARLGKPLWAMFFWIIAALVFAWLAVNLPTRITARVVSLVAPRLQGLLHYTYYEESSFRFGVTYFWLAIFAALTGLLQIPLSDSALFSTSFFGKIAPMLVTMALMAISGSSIDNLNNELLRSPIDAINSTTRFFIDHRGEDVEPSQRRQMHLASLRTVEDLVTPERKFIISGYDENFGVVQVLARFQNAWVECEIFYNQPLSCEQVGNPP
jgi:hypothetical protein